MSEGIAEVSTTQSLPDFQKRAIVGLADIRRRSQNLSSQLDLLTRNTDSSAGDSLKATYQDQSNLVREIMRTDAELQPDDKGINVHLKIGSTYQEIAPNLSALHFSKAASLQQDAGTDYTDSLDRARKSIERTEKNGIPRQTPADFLPDAYILRISRKATDGVDLPTPREVAQACLSDPSLIKDYALVLSETQRDEFLSYFPEEKRRQVSLQLDQAVSSVLNRNLISADEDIEQRGAVKDRVAKAFADAIEALRLPDYREDQPAGGRGVTSRWTSRQIAETISNLGEEDALQVLRDITQRSTREVKDLNKDLRKMPLTDRAKALHPSLSFTARVLETLIEADIKRGGTLAMRYLEMSALPDRLFHFFSKKLVSKEYFTDSLSPFLETGNIAVLKKLMAKYGPQFNTIVDTLAQTREYAFDHNLAQHEAELFEALSDLETLTPRIFDRYRHLPQDARKEFAERLRKLKPQFFRNAPIKGILERSDRDILTEMVYMAYKPMGMSFEQVGQLIGKVDDHTNDLASYTFPQEGFPITLEKEGKHVVKERQKIDIDSLKRFRNLFTTYQKLTKKGEPEPFPLASAFRLLLKPEPADETERPINSNQTANLNALLLPLQGQTRVQDFLARYPSVNNDNAYQIASEMAELTGVYFRDNYRSTLTEYLDSHPAELQQILSILSDVAVRSAISGRLRQFNQGVDWQELDRATEPVPGGLRKMTRAFIRPPSAQPQDVASKILGRIVDFDQMEPIRKQLESELSKFTLGTDAISAYKGQLKAYISKNVGSFFAKAAAGICTAQDIPLFERSDHFHINVVENDESVRANIQAYLQQVNGKPSLILRGFNPTADWVGKIDVGNFCDQIISVGKQFQEANALDATYITEQYGGWHALSNRDQVARYLEGKHIKGKQATPFPLRVTDGTTIREIYQV